MAVLILAAVGAMAQSQNVKAEFPGGEKAMNAYIAKAMKYPAAALENGVEGKVIVNFTVKADGSLDKVVIGRKVDPDLEAEAIRIVKAMPKWKPASDGKSAVDSASSVAISFRLPE